MRSVDGPEPLVDVAQPDSTPERALKPILGHAQPVVQYFDDRASITEGGSDGNPSLADFARQTVLDRVLHERLENHARHDDVQRFGRNLFVDAQLGAET